MTSPELQLPKAPHRLVIGANAHAELAAAIRAARPTLEIRGAKYTDVTTADLAWGEAYLGFKRPPLPSMGNVRWVHCTGAGVDSWLTPDELPRDILLTRTSESFGPMIAEWALARALAFSQQLIDLAQAQRLHRWSPRDLTTIRGSKTVIVGTGDVGTHVAKLFNALGSRVYGVSRSGEGDSDLFYAMAQVSALRDMVAVADYLILTLPLTPETRALIDRSLLSACRGAVLINAGRGQVIDERAIPEALDQGWLKGAALDVFEVEPLPIDSPLWTDQRVIVSPHISGLTTIDGAKDGFLECLADLEAGRAPKWVVDRAKGY
ncbi:MAG: D-2-hydroxyacid dehydrogenase [Gemmatimonadaceae bacterium]